MLKRLLPILTLAVVALGAAHPSIAQDIDLNDPIFKERKEVVLTEDHVQRFIKLKKAEQATHAKFPMGDSKAGINIAKITRMGAELRTLPPKFGFDPKGDYLDVQWTINKLINSFNYETGQYTDPSDTWKKRIADAEASVASMAAVEGMSADDIADFKKSTDESIASMKEMISDPAPRNETNIALVKKYLKELRD